MSALKFNQRIRIERPGDVDAGYGTPTDEWILVVEVWAKVEDVKPSKTDATQQGIRLGRDAAMVWIRYREGITSDMRIVELSGRRRTLSITGGPASIHGGSEMEFSVERFTA